MGRLSDWLEVWEADVAGVLRRIVLPEGAQEKIVDADEVCFFGSVRTLPRSMDYLTIVGTPVIDPEIYVVGLKDGKLIPQDVWFAPTVTKRLEAVSEKLKQGMTKLMEICDEEGYTKPTAVKSAVVVSTGEAFTKYDFDTLPKPPYAYMSAADWSFDLWAHRVQTTGSALQELKNAFGKMKKGI
jgi:hypothetical protein